MTPPRPYAWPRCIGCDAPARTRRSELCRRCLIATLAWRRKTGWQPPETPALPPISL